MKLLAYKIRDSLTFIFNILFRKNIYSSNVDFRANIGTNTVVNINTSVDRNCIIGKYTYIGRYCSITKTKIGNYCSIADNVFIGQGEHDFSKPSTNVIFVENDYEDMTKKPCIIENDVWIGSNANVLRGVTIGNGAVIGAGAIVTKDVPPFAIVVGAPARVLKFRFEDDKIKEIEKTKWWDYDKEIAKKIFKTIK